MPQFENRRYNPALKATVLEGNVRINRSDLAITAERGQRLAPDSVNERIELEGNPVRWEMDLEDGGRLTGTSDRLTYEIGRDTIVMEGNALLVRDGTTFGADRLIYDRINQHVEAIGNVRTLIPVAVLPSTGPDTNGKLE